MRMCLDWHCEWLSLSASLDKAPHFSRLGDEEVNAGQNASFQCVAAGRASEAEKFLLEVSGLTMGFKAKATCVSALDVWLCWIFYYYFFLPPKQSEELQK